MTALRILLAFGLLRSARGLIDLAFWVCPKPKGGVR